MVIAPTAWSDGVNATPASIYRSPRGVEQRYGAHDAFGSGER